MAIVFVTCGTDGNTGISSDISLNITPVITRISPSSAVTGDEVTIFGLGFSVVPQKNIISVGNAATSAETYSLVSPPAEGEIESITFRVPAGVTVGANSIFVTVGENTSNANMNITIN